MDVAHLSFVAVHISMLIVLATAKNVLLRARHALALTPTVLAATMDTTCPMASASK
jgi:hypothetical protein